MKQPFSLASASLGPREFLLGAAVFILILPYLGIFGGEVEIRDENGNAVTEFIDSEESFPLENEIMDENDLEASYEDPAAIDDVNELIEKSRMAGGQDQ